MSDDVVVSSTRCPFCHEHAADEFVVCGRCLAKHHAECWLEHGTCASCGEARCLPFRKSMTAREQVRALWEGPRAIDFAILPPSSRRLTGWLLIALAFVLPAIMFFGLFVDENRKPAEIAPGLLSGIIFLLLAPVFVSIGRAYLRAGRAREKDRLPDASTTSRDDRESCRPAERRAAAPEKSGSG